MWGETPQKSSSTRRAGALLRSTQQQWRVYEALSLRVCG